MNQLSESSDNSHKGHNHLIVAPYGTYLFCLKKCRTVLLQSLDMLQLLKQCVMILIKSRLKSRSCTAVTISER